MEDIYIQWLDWFKNPVLLKVFVVVLATLTANFLLRRLLHRLAEKAATTRTVWDDALVNSIRKPFSLLVWVLGIMYAAELISAGTDSTLSRLIDPSRHLAIIVLLALFLIRFISECEAAFIKNGADITTSQAIGKLLRISIFLTSALTILEAFGISVSGILAFGGMGGIAVGFAAKDLLANFFGGLMLHLDRPFAVGDWVRSPDREIEGTVKTIGWRITMIQTFDKRPLYIPNSAFANITVENPSRMSNRRIYETIGIRYADVTKMQSIVDEVREMLQHHEAIDRNCTLIVNFNSFSPSSLDFFIYAFTKTTNWVDFHGIKQSILLTINQIIESHNAEIAFPTSTIHLVEDLEKAQ